MKAFLFGAGNLYKQYKHIFRNVEILGFLDNDCSKKGEYIDGYEIFSPESITEFDFDYVFIISNSYREMREQLLRYGVDGKKIIDIEQRGNFSNILSTEQYILPSQNSEKALLVSHALNLTGAPIVLCRLAYFLQNNGYDVTVLAEKNSLVDHKYLLGELLTNSVSVILVDSLYMLDMTFYNDFSFYWVNTALLWNIALQLSQMGKKVYWWIHEGDDVYLTLGSLPAAEMFGDVYVLAVGWIARKCFEKYVGGKVYSDLLYGIPNIELPQSISQTNVPIIRVGVVGAYSERKGYDFLWSVIKSNYMIWRNKIEFIFVGDIPKCKSEELKIFECIHILGILEPCQLYSFYENIDALIMPSFFDPMPVVVTEAMQHRKACIVSDMVGQSKYITHGIDGLVFETGNASNLAEQINWVIDNKECLRKLGERSFHIYKRYFSMECFENNVRLILLKTIK